LAWSTNLDKKAYNPQELALNWEHPEALKEMLSKPNGKKRILTPALLLTLLISPLAGALLANLAAANVTLYPPPASVTIQLPESKMYSSSKVPVAFTVETEPDYSKWLTNQYCTYILDGGRLQSWPRQLSEGTHRLRIGVHLTYYLGPLWGVVETSGISNEVVFTVNAAAPRVSVLEPKPAETYNTPKIQLNFTVSEPASWLGYSLDDAAPVTIARNTTLYDLSDGTHTIVVHAEDTTGSTGASMPVTFKVETQTADQHTEPQTAPFSNTWIASSIAASAAISSFGLIAYFLRHSKKRRVT
jgi:hypothetical protein